MFIDQDLFKFQFSSRLFSQLFVVIFWRPIINICSLDSGLWTLDWDTIFCIGFFLIVFSSLWGIKCKTFILISTKIRHHLGLYIPTGCVPSASTFSIREIYRTMTDSIPIARGDCEGAKAQLSDPNIFVIRVPGWLNRHAMRPIRSTSKISNQILLIKHLK